jgi:hypothetical protein
MVSTFGPLAASPLPRGMLLMAGNHPPTAGSEPTLPAYAAFGDTWVSDHREVRARGGNREVG